MISLILILLALSSAKYDRKDWIKPSNWSKARNKVLTRDRVENHWICKYSGVLIKKKSEVDVDHIVPLKYAHDHCGDTLSEMKKRQLATDTLNLVATSRHENRSKGDDGVLEYMPSDNQCWYLDRWYRVTMKYSICIPSADSGYIARGLNACRGVR